MTDQVSSLELLQDYVIRLRNEQDFMAFVLHQFQLQEKLSDEGLAQHLKLSPDALLRLAMCRRPSDRSDYYIQNVRQIAAYATVNEFQLLSILRQVSSIEAIHNLNDGSQLLSAARDHESDSQDE